MVRRLTIGMGLVGVFAVFLSVAHAESVAPAQWLDGDTGYFMKWPTVTWVRLEAINAGESWECMGKEATAYVRALYRGVAVTLVNENGGVAKDAQGRLLRAAYAPDGRNVAHDLILRGLAVFPTQHASHPRAAYYQGAEDIARAKKVGMWAPGACGYKPLPWGSGK